MASTRMAGDFAHLSPTSKSARPVGISATEIAGGFRKITTHQLALAWWLYDSKHLSKRALRVWFALHEIAERRECHARSAGEAPRKRPQFDVGEVSQLVGGAGTKKALKALTSDLRRLSRLGLVSVSSSQIVFAQSVDQVNVADLSGFWAMLAQIQNKGRAVPVPRRMLRALAGGYGRAVTAVIIATLIRSLFWHKETGQFRIDGRTKGSWIAQAFNVSRRAVTDAYAHLIEIGWLEELHAPAWMLNRFGAHHAIDVAWASGAGAAKDTGIASPSPKNAPQSASPLLDRSLPPSEESKKTSIPARRPATPAGVRNYANSGGAGPSLRDVTAKNLDSTDDLLALYEQAVVKGLISRSDASLLDFMAYAERARARGGRPGALFTWLVTKAKREFISAVDDERAAERLRTHRNSRAGESVRSAERLSQQRELTKDEQFYILCLRIARQHRVPDPFYVALHSPQKWTRDRWNVVKASAEAHDRARWLQA